MAYFNREELKTALKYWYEHLEVNNQEQNEAVWCAINTIRYCIWYDSKYTEERPQVTVFAENASKEEIDDFKQELENVLEKTQDGWIPVSERLPDKNIPCLVSVGKFNFTQIAMYSDLMGTINHKIFWQGDYGKNNFENITEYVNAWQPLPEPYKEGNKETTFDDYLKEQLKDPEFRKEFEKLQDEGYGDDAVGGK